MNWSFLKQRNQIFDIFKHESLLYSNFNIQVCRFKLKRVIHFTINSVELEQTKNLYISIVSGTGFYIYELWDGKNSVCV